MTVILQAGLPRSFPSPVQWLHLGSVCLAQLKKNTLWKSRESLAQGTAAPPHEVYHCASEKHESELTWGALDKSMLTFYFPFVSLWGLTVGSVVYFSIFLETGLKFLQVMALLLTFCVCARLLSQGKYKRGIKSQHESRCLNIFLTVLTDR